MGQQPSVSVNLRHVHTNVLRGPRLRRATWCRAQARTRCCTGRTLWRRKVLQAVEDVVRAYVYRDEPGWAMETLKAVVREAEKKPLHSVGCCAQELSLLYPIPADSGYDFDYGSVLAVVIMHWPGPGADVQWLLDHGACPNGGTWDSQQKNFEPHIAHMLPRAIRSKLWRAGAAPVDDPRFIKSWQRWHLRRSGRGLWLLLAGKASTET
jgi:hypothetical protein